MTSDQAANSRDKQEKPGQGAVPPAAIRPFVQSVPLRQRKRRLQHAAFIPGHGGARPVHEGPDRPSAAGQHFPWSGGQIQVHPRVTGDITLLTVPAPRCGALLVLPCS